MSTTPATLRTHGNWFDECRLIFAGAVLVSHSFELVDGSRAREPFTRWFGTCSMGEVAVVGFLALSGYLISSAWAREPNPLNYLRNRGLRIVPAYIVAFLVSVLLVGAASAAHPLAYLRELDWRRLGFDMVTLGQPQTPATFPGQPYPLVNGALWTIQLEFFCYLLTPLAMLQRWSLVGLWALAAADTLLTPSPYARGVCVFLSGAIYWRFGLQWRPLVGLACVPVLLILLKVQHWWAIGLATAGVYLLLGLASRPAPFRLKADISYGLYLYGWPVQNMLIRQGLTAPWALFAASLAIAAALGAASWFGIEKGALKLKRRPPPGRRTDAAQTQAAPTLWAAATRSGGEAAAVTAPVGGEAAAQLQDWSSRNG